MVFADRVDAGIRLSRHLAFLRGDDVVVLGLPRGGVAVAGPVAEVLGASLDVLVVRKLGLPSQPELAIGAVAEGGIVVINDRLVSTGSGIDRRNLVAIQEREWAEVVRQSERFRGGHARVPVAGRTAVVVDDGMATGSTARAACRAARGAGAERVILAVPVASPEAIADLGREVEGRLSRSTARAVGRREFGTPRFSLNCRTRRSSDTWILSAGRLRSE